MLKVRILSGLVMSGLLLLALFMLEPQRTVLVFAALSTIGAWEWAAFGGLHGGAARFAYAGAIALLLLLSWLWTGDPKHLLMLLGGACLWWAIAFLWLVLAPERHQPGLALLCGVPVLVPAFVALSRLAIAGNGFVRGPKLVLWLLLLVIGADIGAYFAGRIFGRRKLAPRVSPGKTWEGVIGGLCAVALVAGSGALYFGLPVLPCVAFGCAVGIFSVVGDLTESMFKRSAGLKDSGALLPGHGGILDRIDSVTAAAPLYALGLFGSGVIA
ncbi:MAG: phosphatidate cytidylyltransferase [Steroidobacteraceae bacterium]